MKAVAKHWLKYGGRWIAPGEAFEVSAEEAAGIAQYANLTEEAEKPEPKPAESKPRAASRRKK